MKTKMTLLFLLLTFLLAACGGGADTPSLAGRAWVLEKIGDLPIVENTAPTLVFGEDGQAGGNGSCNRFGGSYELKAGKLTFGPLSSTMMACLEAGVMEQEAAYLQALQSAAAYQVKDGQLLILDASGQVVLTFAPQDTSLEGKTWTLTAFNDGNNLVSLVIDTQINAEFKDGNLSGQGGCNNYNGPFNQDGKKLSFGPLASTEMACGEPVGVMEQESAYLAALSKVASYAMEGNRLTLFDASGLIMAEFVK